MTNLPFKLDTVIKVSGALIIYYGFIFVSAYSNEFNLDFIAVYNLEDFLIYFIYMIDFLLMMGFMLGVFWFMLYFMSSKNPLNLPLLTPILDSPMDIQRFQQLYSKELTLLQRTKAAYYLIGNTTFLTFIIFVLCNHFLKLDPNEILLRAFTILFFSLFIYEGLILMKRWLKPELNITYIMAILLVILMSGYMKKLGEFTAKEQLINPGNISFDYNGKRVQTTDSLIKIVNTKNFIVLRDLKDLTNKYFEKERVTDFQQLE